MKKFKTVEEEKAFKVKRNRTKRYKQGRMTLRKFLGKPEKK